MTKTDSASYLPAHLLRIQEAEKNRSRSYRRRFTSRTSGMQTSQKSPTKGMRAAEAGCGTGLTSSITL